MKKRKLASVIDTYVDYLGITSTPKNWRTWAGIWLVGTAVERRVWCYTMEDPVYPNLFVFLIGRSGGGKSRSLGMVHTLLNSLGEGRQTASSMTAAFYAQCLADNERTFVNPVTNRGEPYHVANVLTDELSTLFKEADKDLMGKFTKMFDCKEFSEGRRAKESTFYCERTFCSILGGTTMSHLLETFDQSMWNQGFMSRVVMVYGEPGKRKSLRSTTDIKERAKVEADLKHDLKIISEQAGELKFTQEAFDALDAFYLYESESGVQLGGPPIPDYPLLQSYCQRRHIQIEKVMMCLALDEGSDVLTIDHFNKAHALLLEAEADMPSIFKEAGESSDLALVDQVLHKSWKLYIRSGKVPISESDILGFLLARTSQWHAKGIMDLLQNTRKIKKVGGPERKEKGLPEGQTYFIPLAPRFNEE